MPGLSVMRRCYGFVMERLKLPVGIQTFRTIREEGHYYVDKTAHILRLVEGGKHYFLSRPRRFGKSLLLDTVKELFEGDRELFAGLHADGCWDWDVRHPVIRLSFGAGNFTEAGELAARTGDLLTSLEAKHDARSEQSTAASRLGHILETLHRRTGERAVVLVDEYDKPILDALEDPDLARTNRDYLLALYSVTKEYDAHIHFSLITGVSKFSKAGMFSGLNNHIDIRLDARYSTICGFTEADLGEVFAPELPGLDRERIREWYKGYRWPGDERVYNPVDILLLFRTRMFRAHWFETGAPRFLLDTLLERRVGPMELDGMVATDDLLSRLDVGDMTTEALLFQTGYLTITAERQLGVHSLYELGYPNREVRQSLNRNLARHLTRDGRLTSNRVRLLELLRARDFDALSELIHAFYAGIPFEWYTNNHIANYEGYYAAVFYAYFASLGLDIVVEDSSSRGRLDMALRIDGDVFLFEFKVAEQAGERSAMAQLKSRGYAEKYLGTNTPVHLIGVEFSSETRNIAAFEKGRANDTTLAFGRTLSAHPSKFPRGVQNQLTSRIA